jgi:hypothetical protein
MSLSEEQEAHRKALSESTHRRSQEEIVRLREESNVNSERHERCRRESTEEMKRRTREISKIREDLVRCRAQLEEMKVGRDKSSREEERTMTELKSKVSFLNS